MKTNWKLLIDWWKSIQYFQTERHEDDDEGLINSDWTSEDDVWLSVLQMQQRGHVGNVNLF